jgi:hypothetical protein
LGRTDGRTDGRSDPTPRPAFAVGDAGKNIHTKNNKNWFDNDLFKERNNLLQYAKILTKYPKDPLVRGHFFKLRKNYAKLRKFKFKEFKSSMLKKIDELHENNPKMYWELIKKLSNQSTDDKGSLISCNDWIQHFNMLNTSEVRFNSRIAALEERVSELESNMYFNELDYRITKSEISEAISKLKCNKSPGLDRISNHMLKYGQSSLIDSLQKLFNSCLIGGIYPNQWSSGIITVLHKSGDAHDPNNYRGITITSAIGKLMNSVLNNRLDKFLEKHQIINECQIGFTKSARTSDHMFILKNIIETYCMNRDGRLYTCFIDFRKAFDTVIHSGIKYKLLKLCVGTNF